MKMLKTITIPIAKAESLKDADILRHIPLGGMPSVVVKSFYYDQVAMELKLEFDVVPPSNKAIAEAVNKKALEAANG